MGVVIAPAVTETNEARGWWERRWFLVLVVFSTMIPLIYPPVPPLVDLLGHLGHYRVELDAGNSPWIQRYYGFRWAPIANLGVDLLVYPLGKLLGLETALKFIILAIPPLTAAGMLWVSREVHGRVPPTAFFALPFIYGFPFMFGFANYALSVALAFLGFGLWLRLGRLQRTTLRSWLFAPIALTLFFCHIYGWGLLGLMCFTAEAVRARDCGAPWWRAIFRAALHVSPMAVPLLVVLAWPVETQAGARIAWFPLEAKWRWIYAALRDRWGMFDMAAVAFAALMFVLATIDGRMSLSRVLGLSAAVLAAVFLIIPPRIFDSSYADMRLVPYVFAVALLAIRARPAVDPRKVQFFAFIGILFFSVRTAANTASLAIAAIDQKAKLQAIQFIPRGARVATFYGLPKAEPWSLPRNSHLGAMVIVRRDGFSNDQWITAGHNLLVLKYGGAGEFSSDPSEIVRPSEEDRGPYQTIDQALASVPRASFDYIWLINAPSFDKRLVSDLQLVWTGPGTALYRVPH